MSRIGKMPIKIPTGVTLEIIKDNIVVNGPKGMLKELLVPEVNIKVDGDMCTIGRTSEQKRAKQMHGLYRQLVNNMVTGVSNGFTKTLNLIGVGYRAESKNESVTFSLGYSTQIEFMIPNDVSITVPSQDTVVIEGISKQRVGQIASEIRSLRKPEPYKGKGIKYSNEIIRRKEGKTGKK